MTHRLVSISYLFTFFIIAYSCLSAENEDNRIKYGAFLDYNLNLHNANFQKLPGVPNCCPKFTSGMGSGFSLGALYERPYIKDFSLGLRFGYFDYNATLTKDEPVDVIVGNSYKTGTFQHTLNSSISAIGLEPTIIYNAYPKLSVSFGLNVGLLVVRNYSQKETVIGAGTFSDSLGNDTHSAIRNSNSGKIPGAADFNLNFIAGVGYELPLNKNGNLNLLPEIFYSYNLINVVSGLSWNINTFRAGLAIKYNTAPPKQIKREKIEIIDTIKIQSPIAKSNIYVIGKPSERETIREDDNFQYFTQNISRTDTIIFPKPYKLTADITAVGVDDKGIEIPLPSIKIEEFISFRLLPLLNYVFFDEGSDKIPERYTLLTTEQVKSFSEDIFFYYEILPTYYHILNIVGNRMKRTPTATLNIIGCNDGNSMEKNNTGLSQSRANAVKEYLKNIWTIDEKRLKVVVRNLPEKASKPLSENDKMQENRRVELVSDNKDITKPIYSLDTIRKSNPSKIRFKSSGQSEAGMKDWEISAYQDNTILKKFDSAGDIKAINDWSLEKDQALIPRIQKPLNYLLKVNDVKDNSYTTQPKSIEINLMSIQKKRSERIADMEIDKYSLILFDFDKAEITEANQAIIDFIKPKVMENSKVTISGYTDRTGDADYDRNLSLRRAVSAQKALNHPHSTSAGYGKDVLLHDNDLPEGRFYCRTLNITVETPIEK